MDEKRLVLTIAFRRGSGDLVRDTISLDVLTHVELIFGRLIVPNDNGYEKNKYMISFNDFSSFFLMSRRALTRVNSRNQLK